VVFPFSRKALVASAVGLGVLLGLGLFTFIYAEGFSYFTTDPKACANCHIMNSEYDSWVKSSHHIAATCVDCHLPHALVPKLVAKGVNGYHHSKGFTSTPRKSWRASWPSRSICRGRRNSRRWR